MAKVKMIPDSEVLKNVTRRSMVHSDGENRCYMTLLFCPTCGAMFKTGKRAKCKHKHGPSDTWLVMAGVWCLDNPSHRKKAEQAIIDEYRRSS